MLVTDSFDCATDDWVARMRPLVDAHLHKLLVNNQGSPVTEAMRYSVLAPGKRVRPLLTLAITEYLGASSSAAMQVACAIEMIHAASLILDDLPCMDNDQERRNRPATHARFGESLTILAAVSLLTHSCCTIASHGALPEALRLQLVQLLCDTVGPHGLSLGQYFDLHAENLHTENQGRSAQAITDLHYLKTGVLFLAAARAGCLLGGATAAQTERVMQFTNHLGLAFQLLDDLKDRDENRTNIVARIGVNAAEQRVQEHLQAAHAALAGDQHAEVLLEFMHAFFQVPANDAPLVPWPRSLVSRPTGVPPARK